MSWVRDSVLCVSRVCHRLLFMRHAYALAMYVSHTTHLRTLNTHIAELTLQHTHTTSSNDAQHTIAHTRCIHGEDTPMTCTQHRCNTRNMHMAPTTQLQSHKHTQKFLLIELSKVLQCEPHVTLNEVFLILAR